MHIACRSLLRGRMLPLEARTPFRSVSPHHCMGMKQRLTGMPMRGLSSSQLDVCEAKNKRLQVPGESPSERSASLSKGSPQEGTTMEGYVPSNRINHGLLFTTTTIGRLFCLCIFCCLLPNYTCIYKVVYPRCR